MKNIFTGILLMIVVFGNFNSAKAQSDVNTSSSLRDIASVDIKDLSGKAVNTSTFSNAGKPIIIVFWNSVHKFPSKELDAIAVNYADWKKETGVKVIVISVDDSRSVANVKSIINNSDWDFEFYLDVNSDFKRAMNVNLVPQTLLLNGAGKIVWQTTGFIDGDEFMIYDELKKIKSE